MHHITSEEVKGITNQPLLSSTIQV